MSNTTFVENETIIHADWCNDVNDTVYDILGNGTIVPTTKAIARTNLGIGTSDTPLFASVDIGATDTTLSRASAGNLNVEGNLIYRAGGTDVPVLDGGTGSSTAGGARTNLGAAASGANTDITSLSAPALGAATATTQSSTDSSTKVATTAFVQSVITLGNGGAVNTTSGTAVTLLNTIPSTATRVSVALFAVSTASTGVICLRLGPTGGPENSGYASTIATVTGATPLGQASATSGFELTTNGAAANVYSGIVTFLKVPGVNSWIMSCTIGVTNTTATLYGGGAKTLAGVLTQIQLTTTGGTDTFDAGKAVVYYE